MGKTCHGITPPTTQKKKIRLIQKKVRIFAFILFDLQLSNSKKKWNRTAEKVTDKHYFLGRWPKVRVSIVDFVLVLLPSQNKTHKKKDKKKETPPLRGKTLSAPPPAQCVHTCWSSGKYIVLTPDRQHIYLFSFNVAFGNVFDLFSSPLPLPPEAIN